MNPSLIVPLAIRLFFCARVKSRLFFAGSADGSIVLGEVPDIKVAVKRCKTGTGGKAGLARGGESQFFGARGKKSALRPRIPQVHRPRGRMVSKGPCDAVMSQSTSPLRLVRDDEESPASPASASPGQFASAALALADQVESMQREITTLHEEINLLRRRDETLKFYMHRLDEELRLAARLQQDFLPKQLPQVGAVRFHALFRPAGYVSGDLYDITRLDETRVGFYLADAVGHGMPAALLTMFIKRALVTKEILSGGYRLLRPSEAMARLNDALVEQGLTQASFATALYGVIDTQSLDVTFARAGHPNPILIGTDGTIRPLEADGSLLGIFPNETYLEGSHRLVPGDRLFMFTDGIEVAFSPGNGQVDADRWHIELERRRHLTTEQLLTDFAEHIDQESGSLQPKDDLTIIVMEVNR